MGWVPGGHGGGCLSLAVGGRGQSSWGGEGILEDGEQMQALNESSLAAAAAAGSDVPW